MYLVTEQYGSSQPHEREIFEDRERAAFRAMELSGLRAPGNLDADEWERRQGNQHTPTRWRFWYRTQTGHVINVYVRKFAMGNR